jgi:hypothetical protein
MPLNPPGAQTVYDRRLIKSTRKRARFENNELLINDNDDDFITSNTNDTTITQTIPTCTNDYSSNNQSVIMDNTTLTSITTTTTTPTPTNTDNTTTMEKYIFWESKKARDLFAPDEGEKTIVAVHRLITACEELAETSIDLNKASR